MPDHAIQKLNNVCWLVCQRFGIPVSVIFNSARGEDVQVQARHAVMYLLHIAEPSLTYLEVAALVGRDRTTVTHAVEKVEDARDDTDLDAWLDQAEAELLYLQKTQCELEAA